MVFSTHFRSTYGFFDTFSVYIWCFRHIFGVLMGVFGVFPSPTTVFFGIIEPDLEFPSPMERVIESEPCIFWDGMSEND